MLNAANLDKSIGAIQTRLKLHSSRGHARSYGLPMPPLVTETTTLVPIASPVPERELKKTVCKITTEMNKQRNVRNCDYLFWINHCDGKEPKQFPDKNLGCVYCHQPNPDKLVVPKEYSEPIVNGRDPPHGIPEIEWLHEQCYWDRLNERYIHRYGDTDGYKYNQMLKQQRFRCATDGCPHNVDNFPAFQWDHTDALGKTEDVCIGFLMMVIDEVEISDLRYELEKCKMLCKPCHTNKTLNKDKTDIENKKRKTWEKNKAKNEANMKKRLLERDAKMTSKELEELNKRRKTYEKDKQRQKQKESEKDELGTAATARIPVESVETLVEPLEIPEGFRFTGSTPFQVTPPGHVFNFLPPGFMLPVPTPAPVAPPAGPPLPKFDFLNPSVNPVPPQEQAEEDDEDEDDEEVPQNKKAKRQ